MPARFVRQASVDLDDDEYEPRRYAVESESPAASTSTRRHQRSGGFDRWLQRTCTSCPPRGLKAVPVVSVLASVAGVSVAKLGEDYTALQLLVAVAMGRAVLAAAFVRWRRHNVLRIRGDKHLVVAVAVCAFAAMVSNYVAITHLTLADATAIRFLFPIFVAVISTVVWHQRLTTSELVALVMGMGGVVCIAQPPLLFGSSASHGGDGTDPVDTGAVLVAVLGAMATAGTLVSTRLLGMSGVEPAVVVFWLAMLAACAAPLLTLAECLFLTPGWEDWGGAYSLLDVFWFGALSVVTFVGEFLFIEVVQTEPTEPVSVLRYGDVSPPCIVSYLTWPHLRCHAQESGCAVCVRVGSCIFEPSGVLDPDHGGCRGARVCHHHDVAAFKTPPPCSRWACLNGEQGLHGISQRGCCECPLRDRWSWDVQPLIESRVRHLPSHRNACAH